MSEEIKKKRHKKPEDKKVVGFFLSCKKDLFSPVTQNVRKAKSGDISETR